MANRIKFRRAGFTELLTSDAVESDLRRRANAIASQADGDHNVYSGKGKNRARAAVVTADFAAMRAEADRKDLTRAIDAGRR